MRRTLPILIGLMLMSPAAFSEQFYKWKDENGVWHYSAKAPKNQPVDKLKVRTSGSSTEDESEEEDESPAVAKKETEDSPNCKAAKANLQILNTSQQVAKDLDGDGQAENLTLEQHAEEIALAERQKTAFCKPEPPAKATDEEEQG